MKKWLDKYPDGGIINPYQQITGYNPIPVPVDQPKTKEDYGVYGVIDSPMKAYAFEQSYRKAQDSTPTQGLIQLNDTRKVDPTQRFNHQVDREGLTNLIRGAQERGLDPATVLAMSLQETGLSKFNPLHDNSQNLDSFDVMEKYATKYPNGITSKTITDESLDNLSSKMKYAKQIGKTNEADIIQGWNGYGSVENMYGIKGKIDMSKDPVYGKRILDFRDNIIKKTPEVLDIINKTSSKKTMENGGWLSTYVGDGENIPKIIQDFNSYRQSPEGKEYFKMMNDNARAKKISGKVDYSEIDPVTDILLGAGIGKGLVKGIGNKLVKYADNAFIPKAKLFKQSANSLTRGIGTDDKGLQDLVNTGIVRGNPKGRIVSPHEYNKLSKNPVFKEFITKYPDVAEEFASNNLSNKNFSLISKYFDAHPMYTSTPKIPGKISLTKKPTNPIAEFNDYDDYLTNPQKSSGHYIDKYEDTGTPMAFWYESGEFPNYGNYPSKNFLKLNNASEYNPNIPFNHLHPTTSEPIKLIDPNLEVYKTVKNWRGQKLGKLINKNNLDNGRTIPKLADSNSVFITPEPVRNLKNIKNSNLTASQWLDKYE